MDQPTVLTGVPQATLQVWLTQAQTALASLNSGSQPVSASYDGKSVTYMQADRGALVAWIYQLQRALGITRPRRAIVPYFR